MAGHDHQWKFVDAPGGWTGTCWCGLVVTVQTFEPDGGLWTWRFDGRPPAAEVLLESVTSVIGARLDREYVTVPAAD